MSQSTPYEPVTADEPIMPVARAFDATGMARGEPGLPLQFTWRGKTCTVSSVLKRWKQTGDCTSGSGEQYVRKHWYRIRTTSGVKMDVYFERSGRKKSNRWWLHSIELPPGR
jgi:hypothetical protein